MSVETNMQSLNSKYFFFYCVICCFQCFSIFGSSFCNIFRVLPYPHIFNQVCKIQQSIQSRTMAPARHHNETFHPLTDLLRHSKFAAKIYYLTNNINLMLKFVRYVSITHVRKQAGYYFSWVKKQHPYTHTIMPYSQRGSESA